MKTNVISIKNGVNGRKTAMAEAEHFADYHHLSQKHTLQLRLLAEEAVSAVYGILNVFQYEFWLESEPTANGILCRIFVSANADVDSLQEKTLLGLSSSGKNEEERGIVGLIRQALRRSMQATGDVAYHYAQNSSGDAAPGQNLNWSLKQYRSSVEQDQETETQEWDELEKSIVANLADEVKVSISSFRAEVIIEKCFPKP